MAFCSSCNSANSEGAKFCAHCGKPLSTAAPSQQPPVQPERQPAMGPRADPLGDSAARPRPVPDIPASMEPNPNAPGQTRFFVAAAGVSTGSKIRRVVFFFVGAIIIGAVVFFGLRFALRASSENVKARISSSDSTQSQPANEQPPAAPSADK